MTLIMSESNGEEILYGEGSIHAPTIAPDGVVPSEFSWRDAALWAAFTITLTLPDACQSGGGDTNRGVLPITTSETNYDRSVEITGPATVEAQIRDSSIKTMTENGRIMAGKATVEAQTP